MKQTVKLCVLSALCALVLCGCGAGKQPASRTLDGAGSDTLHTMFFDYAVRSAARADTCQDAVPAEGKAFVCVNVAVTSTAAEDIPMKDADFTLRWGEGDDAVAWPRDAATETMMPLSYTLAPGESVQYDLVFEVPAEQTEFSLCTADYYFDEAGAAQTGDAYTLHLTA